MLPVVILPFPRKSRVSGSRLKFVGSLVLKLAVEGRLSKTQQTRGLQFVAIEFGDCAQDG